jgi:hypothetical protein
MRFGEAAGVFNPTIRHIVIQEDALQALYQEL